jgi:hypothetical protein
MVSSVALCSVFTVIRCLPLSLLKWATPFSARLIDSVAPEVQISSRGSQLTSAATCPRAFSTAFSASQPYAWLRDAGLPKFCRSHGTMASTTRGSTGVVAE